MERRLTVFASTSHLSAGECDRIISVANGKIASVYSTSQHKQRGTQRMLVEKLSASYNYYVEHTNKFTGETFDKLAWLFNMQPVEQTQNGYYEQSYGTNLGAGDAGSHEKSTVNETCSISVEIGPRLTFATANSTNILSICKTLGITDEQSQLISRVEQSITYRFWLTDADSKFIPQLRNVLTGVVCDVITEILYDPRPTLLADVSRQRRAFFCIDILQHFTTTTNNDEQSARSVLLEANQNLRLGFDEQDIQNYLTLFARKLERNPTNVELLDLAQSNSEHSRHWFFKGRLIIDGQEMPKCLLDEVMSTTEFSNPNNVIKFCDNSSGIVGFPITQLKLSSSESTTDVAGEKLLDLYQTTRHIIFTAETHNFPTAVEPFSGATTGTGGRIRDVQACGRGAHVIAATVGYCFGNLTFPSSLIDDGSDTDDSTTMIQNQLTWQDSSFTYPNNFAAPLKIAIEASNGASDYGNKFGEPVICGFARSFGARLHANGGERCEWIKPIMFSGGIGSIEHEHVNKFAAHAGMAVVKLGGPAYPIGVGGGAASSTQVQGGAATKHDLHAVQRGDAQMEQKTNRVIRACIELLERNPIRSIHDQGAGGNANVLKEIVEPCGADIYADRFGLGDSTMSIDELWIAEYQENLALLIDGTTGNHDLERFKAICEREKCPYSVVGETNDFGRIVLHDFSSSAEIRNGVRRENGRFPVDLPVGDLLLSDGGGGNGGSSTRKTFQLQRNPPVVPVKKFGVDSGGVSADRRPETPLSAVLDKILLLPSVASKRWLTNKVDRSVSGLVAQQQCVGPWHTPLADYALVALSEFPNCEKTTKLFRGAATAIGEQPIKTTLDPARGARLTVAEALSNLVFCCITELADVKCSANWMWPAKLPGEGAKLYDACISMCEFMRELNVAVDGGKDSLSMAAQVGGTEDGDGVDEKSSLVKAPDALVISAYAPCPDILRRCTPEFKQIGSKLMFVRVSSDEFGLKGTAFAQVMQRLNDETLQMCDVKPEILAAAFRATQKCVGNGLVLAGHDVSDGGLLVCLLEMAFASENIGFDVDLSSFGQNRRRQEEVLFGEPIGWILEIQEGFREKVGKVFAEFKIESILFEIGATVDAQTPTVRFSSETVDLFGGRTLNQLRMQWERMSFELEKQQCHRACVESEQNELARVKKLANANNAHAPYEIRLDLDVYKRLSTKSVQDFSYRVGVVREEGTNGDRELAAAFQLAGFEVWDITMSDLVSKKGVVLDSFNGLAFAGGFSFGDVCGSARGWAAEFKFNDRLRRQLRHFTRQRADTFTLGVCNGCQLMCLLDLVYDDDDENEKTNSSLHEVSSRPNNSRAKVELHENLSGRFESRFACVHIPTSTRSIMLRSLRGSTLGVWVAHHEGRFSWGEGGKPELEELQPNLALQYVDFSNSNAPTEVYPYNPNGSPHGVAGLCSADGRHLALMPHPERSVWNWQWPWMPASMHKNEWVGGEVDGKKMESEVLEKYGEQASPWLLMFESAKCWLRSLSTTGGNAFE